MANPSSPAPDVIDRLRNGPILSFAMLAGMQLDVFTPLKDGPNTLEQVADALGVRPLKLRPLMYTLVVAGLLKVEDELFSNTPESDHFLVKGSPAYVGNLADNLVFRWSALSKTAETIRTGTPQARLDFSETSEAELETFLRGLHQETMLSGRELAEKYDFTKCQTFVDVGGGSGGLAIAIAQLHPHLKATVVDLPTILPITQRIIDETGISDRIQVHSADILGEPLSGSYDVAVLRSLIQVLSPEDAVKALRNIREAIVPGGAIHIIGRVLDNSRLSPVSSVGFSLLSLNNYDHGQAYTEQEHRDWLAEAGFQGFEMSQLSAGFRLISAQRP